jgi:hypothetical protein
MLSNDTVGVSMNMILGEPVDAELCNYCTMLVFDGREINHISPR